MDIAPPKKPVLKSGNVGSTGSSGMIAVPIIIGVIIGFLFSYGAARLSYNTYGSYAWAFLAFIFSAFYYPYYAFFVNKPATLFGGRRK